MEGKFIKGTLISKRKHHIVKSERLNESNKKHSKGHHQKPGGSRDNIKDDRHGGGKTGSDISKENGECSRPQSSKFRNITKRPKLRISEVGGTEIKVKTYSLFNENLKCNHIILINTKI